MESRTPDRTVPRQSDARQATDAPPPTPTQDEADELKQQAHGEDGTDTAPPTAPPANVDVPHVSGTGTVGQTLNCTMGNWDNMGSGAVSYAYQWRSDTADVGDGTANYVVAAGDAGHSIACVVTATNALGSTAAPPSNAVSVT
jgi:hypothetical protein